MAFTEQWGQVLKTVESIRTGTAQGKLDFSSMSSEALELFYQGRYSQLLAAGRDLASRFDFSSCRNLLDVAGGSGALAVAVTEACPGLRATVIDLPSVTPITQRLVAEAGATDRVQVVAADVVSSPLTGSYDVAVMKSFIQILGPEEARRALTNVSQVIRPGGVLYIYGSIMDDSRVTPPEMVVSNLNMLNTYDEGAVYSEQEYRAWLAEAGFTEGFQTGSLLDAGEVPMAPQLFSNLPHTTVTPGPHLTQHSLQSPTPKVEAIGVGHSMPLGPAVSA